MIGFDIEQHVYGEQRYPAQLVIQDVLTIHGRQFRDADLIVASPPCQEYSYMAMPWSIAKQKARDYEDGTRDRKQLTALFDACFRIQREASEAAGRHIPLVVENVRGAQRWVGRARWNFGSFYLWGDVPALMPITLKHVKVPTMGAGWYPPDHPKHVPGLAFNGHADRHVKNTGGSWFNIGSPGQKETGRNPVHELAGVKIPPGDGVRNDKGRSAALHNYDQLRDHMERGVKGFTPSGEPLGKNTLGRKHVSRSKARKAASAMIAKIPLVLARHIAAAWKPDNQHAAACG